MRRRPESNESWASARPCRPTTSRSRREPRSTRALASGSLRLAHTYIGTEHILLGLLREGEGVGAQVLIASGIGLATVRQEVLRFLSSHDPEMVTRIEDLPPETQGRVKVMGQAQRLAGNEPVRPHHLLLAIVSDQNSLAARALAALGVTPDALAEKLAEPSTTSSTEERPDEPGGRWRPPEVGQNWTVAAYCVVHGPHAPYSYLAVAGDVRPKRFMPVSLSG